MKILFCRNIHDENGKLHWWLKNANRDIIGFSDCRTKGLGFRALTKEGVTFEQFVEEHIKYQKDNPYDYDIPIELPTYIDLLEDLAKMIKFGICVIKEEK